jgi:hypothetical protein
MDDIDIAFPKEEMRKVGAVLTGDTSDKSHSAR